MRDDAAWGAFAPALVAAYLDLLARITRAETGPELLALVPELVAFDGGTRRRDFAETWRWRWRQVVDDAPPVAPWQEARP